MHRLPTRVVPADRDRHEPLSRQLITLFKLELELGVAETRALLVSAATAIVVAVPALVLLLAAFVILLAAAFAPLFGAAWQHLLIAGGATTLLALGALAWSAWRFTHLSWPKETVATFQENWRWLGAQLRSRLRLR